MINRDTITRIMDTAIIEEVIGDFVHLKRAGTTFKGLSPFSNERTPSFFVVPHKGIYKDFSSGKGGNVVDFLMEHEKLNYPEALRWLASKYNIEIEEETPSEDQIKERSDREQLSIVTEFARKFFEDQMHDTEEGQAIGLSYFKERGFRDDIIRKFQLGYSPEQRDALTKEALSKGYSQEFLEKTGLTRQRDGGAPYDFFRGRVMFPIHNVSGKVIAFGGRTLKSEKDIAKYFNSPESELYHKSKVLYGIHLAKQSIVKNDICYLVEGYTDVISLVQAGVENVVGSSGTSLTEDQIRLIRRYTFNVTILYDGDAAGIRASFRGINMLLEQGMNVKVVLFPDGDDPDGFSKKVSSSELQEYLTKNAMDFMVFKTNQLLGDVGNDPVKRAGLIRDIVESIAVIPDTIKRNVYLQECSRLMNMREAVLIAEMNKMLVQRSKKGSTARPNESINEEISDWTDEAEREEFDLYHQERDYVRLLLAYGEHIIELPVENEDGHTEMVQVAMAEFLIGSLEQDGLVLEAPEFAKVYNEYVDFIAREEFPEPRHFTLNPDQEISALSSDLLTTQYALSLNWTARHNIHPETEDMLLRKAAKDCIFRLKLRKVMQNSKNIIKEMEEAGDNQEKLAELLSEKILLDKARSEIAKYFGSVVLE
ncbi:MAG: DNA primase [Flavobacteriales bacterium]|nr:DNA primase [Flavobacteriales bacterium]